jgi:hypothetical protein
MMRSPRTRDRLARGAAARSQSHQCQRALEVYKQAEAMVVSTSGADSSAACLARRKLAGAHMTLGELLQGDKQYVSAREQYEAALAMLEMTVVGYMAVRCREEIALEWRAVGAVDDDTSDTPTSASTLLRLLQCVWLPCNLVDVLALAVLRASLLATTAAPARVHSQFYSLGCVPDVPRHRPEGAAPVAPGLLPAK